jgi:hypothetical protein
LIELFLLSKPTPTMGAPPTVTPGEPKAPELLPVVCVPFVVTVPPVAVVPPIPGEDPKPLLVSVPAVPVGEADELLPNAEPEFPPKDELPLPNEEDPEEPKGDEEEPEEPKGEEEEPEEPKLDEEPKLEEEDPNELPEALPVPVVVPVVVPVLAPVGVMPPVCCSVCPNKPIAGTLASPRWMMRQSSFPVMGSR